MKGDYEERLMRKKRQSNNSNKRMKYYLIYSVLFVIMCWAIFHCFFMNNISFIWKVDGWTQHVKALAYYSNWLQNIVKGIIYKHRLEIPLVFYIIMQLEIH